MKYLSLFSGIGGFELGIQQAYESSNVDGSKKRGVKKDKTRNERQGLLAETGKDSCAEERPVSERLADGTDQRPLCIGFSEIDKYATAIYQKHFSEHKNYGDITKIEADKLPDFDFLCGGFPCQSFSIAGKRRGFSDTRGTLFFDIARILKAKQPRLFLLENVKGLLSHDNGNTFKTIISTLDELGYDLQWQVLNSKNFGVPQNRERVFIIGHLRGTSRPEVFPIGTNSEADIVLPTLTARYYGAQANGGYIRNKPEQVNSPVHSNDRVYAETGISPTLNTMQGGRRQPKILQKARGNNRGGEHEISTTISSSSWKDNNHLLTDAKIRRLTPLECERLQGFPDEWTEGVSDTQRYKCLGNAVTVNVIQAIIEKLSPTHDLQ